MFQAYYSKLAKHCHESPKINDNRNATILQNNIKTAATRRHHEDKQLNNTFRNVDKTLGFLLNKLSPRKISRLNGTNKMFQRVQYEIRVNEGH